jgi:ABC-2 type transport system ATP-binding protein
MPTEPYFYSYMTVGQVGAFHSDFYADFSVQAYETMVDSFGLNKDMKMTQLSSGMAAKLKLAVAAARDAKFIMLDEPLNGIDMGRTRRVHVTIIEKAVRRM